MNATLKNIISGLIAGAVFLILYLILPPGFIFSLLAASMVYVLSSLIIPVKKKTETHQKHKDIKKYGISSEMINEVIVKGNKKVEYMKESASKINDTVIRNKVKSIIYTSEKIFEDFKKDPKDIKRARQFLNYYLDATTKVIKQYVNIKSNKINSNRAIETLKKVESLLDTLDKAFKNQLHKLYEDDVMDLEVELSVLEKTIKMEGMGE